MVDFSIVHICITKTLLDFKTCIDNLYVQPNVCVLASVFFYVFTCMYKDIVEFTKFQSFLNLVDDAQCQTSIDRTPKFVS